MGKPTRMLSRTLANPSRMPVTQEEIIWARNRPPQARTQLPRVGHRVGYRHWPYDEVIPAVVVEIDLETPDDWNIWKVQLDEQGRPVEVDGRRVLVRVDDPWPSVLLDTRDPDTNETNFGMVLTREARLEGSAGWMPWRGPASAKLQQARAERT